MTSMLWGLMAALLLTAPAAAALSPKDQAAIAAVETRLTARNAAADKPAKALATRMAELKVPGVSIAFIEDGKVKWTRTYGVAEAGGKAVTPRTLFQAASMSKTVAAAGALRMVDQGKLDLDRDINAHMTAWQVPASPFTAEQKVTLRRLLSHTAGLTVSGFPGYQAGKPVPATVQILNGEPPANTPAVRSFEAPGGKLAYSGGGYTVAQLAMTEAGGRAYGRLLDELVLGPAGMKDSSYAQPLPDADLPRAASGHGPDGAVIPGARNVYPEYAAASLWTTPADYGRFLIALQDAWAGKRGAILKALTARAMMTPVDSGYGLGVALSNWGGRTTFGHGGSNRGFQCNSVAFLDGSRQGVVVMTNSDMGGALVGEIIWTLGAAYGWGQPDPPGGPMRRAPYVPAPVK